MSAPRTFLRYTSEAAAQIATRIVDDALAQGWRISVNDGEEWTVVGSDDRAAILAAMNTTEADTLRFTRQEREIGGWVTLVWSNSHDVIHDHSARPVTEQIIAGAVALADSLEGAA
jgi:hypothetical protein